MRKVSDNPPEFVISKAEMSHEYMALKHAALQYRTLAEQHLWAAEDYERRAALMLDQGEPHE